MWAYILMKEKKLLLNLEDFLIRNQMDVGDTTVNKVMAFGQEVQIINIFNQNTSSFSSVV